MTIKIEKQVAAGVRRLSLSFAIILDYGGPALAKIITAKLGGPSLVTMYRSARCNYAIPQKLEAQIFSRAASFYKEIGYTGVFSLPVDATAITPLLKVKGNRLIGLASETEVVLKTAEDIINVVKDENTEKAKQANAFVTCTFLYISHFTGI